MKRDGALVSVIIPMYNAEDYVSGALASILCEKEIPLEVIVVNDKSTDNSLALVLSCSDDRIRVIEGPGRGIAACMNAGLAEVKGAVVMRCDADDLYQRERIRRQVKWLRANPDYAAVCGAFSTIDRNGRKVADIIIGTESLEVTDELRSGVLRTHLCSYAIRSDAIEKTEGFRDFFESAEDIDMQLRLGEIGRIGYLPEVSYFYRVHAASVTHRQDNALREFFERTAHDFQRQRRTSGLDDLQKGCPPSKPLSEPFSANRVDAQIQGMLLGRAWREHSAGQKAKSIGIGLRALAANPTNLKVWKSLVSLVFKRTVRK